MTSQEDGAIGGLHLIVWPLAFLPAFIHLVSLSLSPPHFLSLLLSLSPSILPLFNNARMPLSL